MVTLGSRAEGQLLSGSRIKNLIKIAVLRARHVSDTALGIFQRREGGWRGLLGVCMSQ